MLSELGVCNLWQHDPGLSELNEAAKLRKDTEGFLHPVRPVSNAPWKCAVGRTQCVFLSSPPCCRFLQGHRPSSHRTWAKCQVPRRFEPKARESQPPKLSYERQNQGLNWLIPIIYILFNYIMSILLDLENHLKCSNRFGSKTSFFLFWVIPFLRACPADRQLILSVVSAVFALVFGHSLPLSLLQQLDFPDASTLPWVD